MSDPVNPLAALKIGASIFDPVRDLPSLRADRLMQVARQLFPRVSVTDAYLWEKLTAAEVLLEQETRTYFAVREILPTGATDAERAALVAGGATVVDEPGYDYDPNLFAGGTWGLLQLRHKPLVTIHSLAFAYPNPTDITYTIPLEWIRPDRKYARLNIVPASGTILTVPLTGFLLNAIGGNQDVPLMIQARYQAGMPNVRAERPDIVDAIKKGAVLSILEDQFLSQSGSVSADGLSQSLSMDVAKHGEQLATRVAKISSSLNGVQMAFC